MAERSPVRHPMVGLPSEDSGASVKMEFSLKRLEQVAIDLEDIVSRAEKLLEDEHESRGEEKLGESSS